MELPEYHMPAPKNVFKSTFDRGWSFIKRAGTVILLASILIWTFQNVSLDSTKSEVVMDVETGEAIHGVHAHEIYDEDGNVAVW